MDNSTLKLLDSRKHLKELMKVPNNKENNQTKFIIYATEVFATSNDINELPKKEILNNNNKSFRMYLIRHGEGIHNEYALKYRKIHGQDANPYLDEKFCPRDPVLTEVGELEAKSLNHYVLKYKINPTIFFSSPLVRTLQTMHLAFNINKNSPNDGNIFVHESIREQYGIHLCDERRNITDIQIDYPNVDFAHMKTISNEDIEGKNAIKREDPIHLVERGYEFMELLEKEIESEAEVVVSTHSSFLLAFSSRVLTSTKENKKPLGRWFATGELRAYDIEFVLKE